MSVVRFRGDDDGYKRWLREHPRGYVVNTTPTAARSYRKLHVAACRHIRELQPPYETWTAGDYMKVCAEHAHELDAWFRDRGGPVPDRTCMCLR